jgi:hypothetical protein
LSCIDAEKATLLISLLPDNHSEKDHCKITLQKTMIVTLLLIAAAVVAVVVAQSRSDADPLGECPGLFEGQPCVRSDGLSGACQTAWPSCAVAQGCEPYYMCEPGKVPLSTNCTEAGARCVVVFSATVSALGACVQVPCATDQPQCAPSFKCMVSPKTTTTTRTTTTAPETVWMRTIVVPDQRRVEACRDKSEGGACTIDNRSGSCSYRRPTAGSQRRKRVPEQLQCFEFSDMLCENKKVGAECADGAVCRAANGEGSMLRCAHVIDAPNSSEFVALSSLLVLFMVMNALMNL